MGHITLTSLCMKVFFIVFLLYTLPIITLYSFCFMGHFDLALKSGTSMRLSFTETRAGERCALSEWHVLQGCFPPAWRGAVHEGRLLIIYPQVNLAHGG